MNGTTLKNNYKGLPLSITTKNHEGFNTNILDRISDCLNCMIHKHCKVFFIPFGLTYPANSQYPNDNILLSRFIEALTLYCKRTRRSKRTGNLIGNYDPKYVWTKELSTTTGQYHYHILLLLDGNKIQNAHGISKQATQLWAGCLGIQDARGLVHLPLPEYDYPYGGIMITRNDPYFQQVYATCFQIASYIAKVYSKGSAPLNSNEYGSSRLPASILS